MLHDSVHVYLCTGKSSDFEITTDNLPEETLKFVIQKGKK